MLHPRRSTRRHVLALPRLGGIGARQRGGREEGRWGWSVEKLLEMRRRWRRWRGWPSVSQVKFRACFTFACESSCGSCATLSHTFYADCRIVVACRRFRPSALSLFNVLGSKLASPSLADASDSNGRGKFSPVFPLFPFPRGPSDQNPPALGGGGVARGGRQRKNEARADGGLKRRW